MVSAAGDDGGGSTPLRGANNKDMANHCIEVLCCNCGAAYCLRGCSYDLGPNPMLTMVIEEVEKECYIGEPCKYCGALELIIE